MKTDECRCRISLSKYHLLGIELAQSAFQHPRGNRIHPVVPGQKGRSFATLHSHVVLDTVVAIFYPSVWLSSYNVTFLASLSPSLLCVSTSCFHPPCPSHRDFKP